MKRFHATTHRLFLTALVCFILLMPIIPPPAFASYVALKDYDVVILRGRVIDPESGLDAVRNIGINKGTVRAIT